MNATDTKQHTPGPWKVISPGHGLPTNYLCVQLGADESYTTLEMKPADATIVAAAPEMLAELEETAAWLDSRAANLLDLSHVGGPTKQSQEKRQLIRDEAAKFRARAMLIRALITKAKGGAS